MAYKNYDMLSLQQKVNEIDNKAEKKYVEDNINKINTSLEEKASKVEVDLERKRIDNLINISSGEVDNVEISDARIGANGIVYDNLGNTIRLQLNEKIDGDIPNSKYYWEAGAYDRTGKKIGYANETHTRTITFLPTRLKSIINNNDKSIDLLVYNNEETFQEVISIKTGSKQILEDNKLYNIHIAVPFTEISTIINSIIFESKPNKYDNLISETKRDVGLSEVASGTTYTNISVKADGTEATYLGWYTSGYRKINGYKYLIVEDLAHFENPQLNAISFYDENKTFISGLNSSNISGAWISGYKSYSGTIEVPSNAYYFRDSKYNYNSKESINVIKLCNFTTPITDIPSAISNLQTEIKDGAYTKIDLGKVLCIGDSLTEGDYGSNPAGTMNVKAQNYPYYLNKFLNKHYTATIINAGKCGYTATTYWESKVKTIDFTNVKIIVIMLGTNGYLTDTVDTDTTITDGQTYENYKNTHTGNYCKIIEYCLEQTENKAQIFLVTPPKTSARDDDKMKLTGEVVKKIGEKYSLKVLDGRNEFGISSCNFSTMLPIDGLHGGKLAYKKIGTYVGSNIISNLSYEIED